MPNIKTISSQPKPVWVTPLFQQEAWIYLLWGSYPSGRCITTTKIIIIIISFLARARRGGDEDDKALVVTEPEASSLPPRPQPYGL